jgi:hypothetical protein
MLAAIGRVAGECASVEYLLRDLFSHLIGSEYGHVITAGDDLSNIALQCSRVGRYNHTLTDRQVDQLTAIRNKIDGPRMSRNFLIHAVWEKGTRPGEHFGVLSKRVPAKAGRGGTHDVQVWTPTDAHMLADQFQRIAQDIREFIEEAFGPDSVPLPIDREVWGRFELELRKLDTPSKQPPEHA